jgi:hypothetical protein
MAPIATPVGGENQEAVDEISSAKRSLFDAGPVHRLEEPTSESSKIAIKYASDDETEIESREDEASDAEEGQISSPVGKSAALQPGPGLHTCGECGKTYKHKNCLIKHNWEHHDLWAMTKRMCATKHQQVQLLEAAQVLSEMVVPPSERVKLELTTLPSASSKAGQAQPTTAKRPAGSPMMQHSMIYSLPVNTPNTFRPSHYIQSQPAYYIPSGIQMPHIYANTQTRSWPSGAGGHIRP